MTDRIYRGRRYELRRYSYGVLMEVRNLNKNAYREVKFNTECTCRFVGCYRETGYKCLTYENERFGEIIELRSYARVY